MYSSLLTLTKATTTRKQRKRARDSGLNPDAVKVEHASKVIILTRDQKNTLDGPNRQFIVGAAGTGKTVVLQEKALQLLREKQNILVLAANRYAERYRELFDTYEFHGWEVQSWFGGRSKENTRDWLIHLGNRSNKKLTDDDLVNSFGPIYERVRKMKPGDTSLIRADLDNRHILVDDTFDEHTEGDTNDWRRSAVAAFALMSFMGLRNPDKTVWIAIDPFKIVSIGKNLYNHEPIIMDSLEKSSASHYSVSILAQSMRCPEKVFNVAYDWLNPEKWFKTGVNPRIEHVISHKVQGLQVSFAENRETYELAQMTAWEKLKSELQHLVDLKIDFSTDNVAIVVREEKQQKKGRDFFRFITDQFEQFMSAIEASAPEFPEESGLPGTSGSVISKNAAKYSSGSQQIQKESNRNDRRKAIINSQRSLNINHWHQVSSREWPIVFYVVCVPVTESSAEAAYCSYRAASRATGKLVMIYVTYGVVFAVPESAVCT